MISNPESFPIGAIQQIENLSLVCFTLLPALMEHHIVHFSQHSVAQPIDFCTLDSFCHHSTQLLPIGGGLWQVISPDIWTFCFPRRNWIHSMMIPYDR